MSNFNTNFLSNKNVFLVLCPKCHHDNYAMAVCHGVCAWCGYNANEDEDYKSTLKEDKNES